MINSVENSGAVAQTRAQRFDCYGRMMDDHEPIGRAHFVRSSDYDALAAQLAEAQQQVTDNFNAGCSIARKLAEAERERDAAWSVARAHEETIAAAAREREALRELAQWMTGCGYDFTQHKYFVANQNLLAGSGNTDATLERT